MALLDEAIAAHGGIERWRAIEEIELRFRCGGLAMPMKGRPGVLNSLHAVLDPRRPHVEFDELGTFDADDGRPEGMPRRLRWTDADVLHFAGYAIWNYVTTPFLFAEPGFVVAELPGRRLQVQFPDHIPTHSRLQTFRFGEDGLLRRLDYTADVIGRWARVAHRCREYRPLSGLMVPTRRRVVPRGLPGPTLVKIAIDEFHARP